MRWIFFCYFICTWFSSGYASEGFTYTLAGDVMLGRHVAEGFHPLKKVESHLAQGDLTLVNQEFVFTNSTHHIGKKAFYFKAPPSHVSILSNAGIDFVSLANNHSLDYGKIGLKQTLAVLQKKKITFAGAGFSFPQASEAALFSKKGKRIAVIAATDNMPEWETCEKACVNFCAMDSTCLKRLTTQISDLKKNGIDFVIISFHWGGNWVDKPSPVYRYYAHTLLDAGADLIFGHSAHTLQGIEVYKGKPIFYSLGNVIDDYELDPKWINDLSILAHVDYNNLGQLKKIRITPIQINALKTQIADQKNRDIIFNRIKKLSALLGSQIFSYLEIF